MSTDVCQTPRMKSEKKNILEQRPYGKRLDPLVARQFNVMTVKATARVCQFN